MEVMYIGCMGSFRKLSRGQRKLIVKKFVGGVISSLAPTSHSVHCLHCDILYCQEFITIAMNSWYCSERIGNKGKATPCVVVLYTLSIQGVWGLAPGKFRPSEITFSSKVFVIHEWNWLPPPQIK